MAYLVRKTKRLIIRPLKASDYSQWKISNTTMLPPQNTWDHKNRALEEVTRIRFRKVLSHQMKMRKQDYFFDLGVFEKSSGALIGTVALMNVLRGASQSAFLGYRIHNRYWNRGYGKEAVLAAMEIGFVDLKLHRLEAGVEPPNRRSILLSRSLGFRKEGLKRGMVYLREKWQDLIIYAITCEELGIKWNGEIRARVR